MRPPLPPPCFLGRSSPSVNCYMYACAFAGRGWAVASDCALLCVVLEFHLLCVQVAVGVFTSCMKLPEFSVPLPPPPLCFFPAVFPFGRGQSPRRGSRGCQRRARRLAQDHRLQSLNQGVVVAQRTVCTPKYDISPSRFDRFVDSLAALKSRAAGHDYSIGWIAI